MNRSLFRWNEKLLLFICYVVCFVFNMLFNYIKTVHVDSFLLNSYLKQFYDFQTYIVFAITSIVVIFHYRMLNNKKTEIYCRYLVGDNLQSISIKYALDCSMILLIVLTLTEILALVLSLNFTNNIYLSGLLFIYILISSRKAGKIENF